MRQQGTRDSEIRHSEVRLYTLGGISSNNIHAGMKINSSHTHSATSRADYFNEYFVALYSSYSRSFRSVVGYRIRKHVPTKKEL